MQLTLGNFLKFIDEHRWKQLSMKNSEEGITVL